MPYDLQEHRHRFAVWAAGRAAQRGLPQGSIPILREALEHCGIREYLSAKSSASISSSMFDRVHRAWCRSILRSLEHLRGATFGRAAKLVAIYAKTVVTLGCEKNRSLAGAIHPPIDGILLSKMARCSELLSPHKKEWKDIRWTKLGEEEYYELINQLRDCLKSGEPFWMLERHWDVSYRA